MAHLGHQLFWVGLLFALSVSALASTSNKLPVSHAPVHQEIYSAMETDAEPMLPPAPPAQVLAIAQPTLQHQSAAPLPPAPEVLPDAGLSYDPVPSDQIEAIGRRLQLVDTIVRRHGRAYDYRTHTVRDLELILSKLDASVRPVTSSR